MQTRKETPIRQEYILLFMSDTHSEQPGQQLTHNWGRTAAFGEQSLQEGRLQRVYIQCTASLRLCWPYTQTWGARVWERILPLRFRLTSSWRWIYRGCISKGIEPIVFLFLNSREMRLECNSSSTCPWPAPELEAPPAHVAPDLK